jgi:hypothetical protein
MGRSLHGAQLAVIQPSFRHKGFDSSPTHEQQCASRLTGRAPGSYPGEDWVRGPEPRNTRRSKSGSGRRPELRASEASRARTSTRRRSSAGQSDCLSSRRPRVRIPSVAPLVDVVQWTGHRPTKPEGAGSTPAVDAPSHRVARRSSGERAPPSEGGRRTFESCRRGPGSEPAG